MIAQSARRPLGCWKTVLRQARQQRSLLPVRRMATETTPTTPAAEPESAPSVSFDIPKPASFRPNKLTKPKNWRFAVYPRVESARKTTPEAMVHYHAQQIRRLDRTGARTALFSKKNPDSAKVGDVLQVTTTKGDPFAGVCLSIKRAGVDSAILLRNHISRVGVEMWFKIYSPKVLGIEIVWRRPKRARRARLTYMRKPRHDMGNVDKKVEEWRRSRNIFTTKGGAAAKAKKAAAAAGKKA